MYELLQLNFNGTLRYADKSVLLHRMPLYLRILGPQTQSNRVFLRPAQIETMQHT